MFRIAVIVIATAILSNPAFGGSVQCECPSVDAKGTGDTSCSATESGSECTVDFNTFNPKDEQAAFDALSQSSQNQTNFVSLEGIAGTRFLTPQSATILASKDNNTLIDLLLIYVLVSAVQTDGIIIPNDFEDLQSAMHFQSSNVVSAFLDGSGGTTFSGGSLTALVRHGCVEVTDNSSDYWGMYKAFWSEFAEAPQCR